MEWGSGVEEAVAAPTATPNKIKKIRRDTKRGRVLEALSRGESLNLFEAVRRYHDWVLRSTISDLERYGVRIERQIERVPGYNDSTVYCSRYWMEPEQRKKARELLGLEEAA